VRRYLADRDLLLLLDNCEHVLDACAQLAATLLGACPNLRILATSHEPLDITGEAVWRLEPLVPEHSYRLFWSGPGSEGMSWSRMRRQKLPFSRLRQD
jgi:predicted ATPase